MSRFSEEVYYLPDPLYFSPLKLYIAGTTFADADYNIKRPQGAIHYVLEYVISGQGYLHYGDKIYNIEGGDIYLIHPGIPHEYYANKNNPWHKMWFNVGGRLIDSLVESYNLEDTIYCPQCPLYKEFKQGLDLIKSAEGRVHSELGVILHDIFAKMNQWQSTTPYQNKSQQGIALREYIDIHFREPITLQTLADLIKKSEAQMLRIFKNDWSVSPNVYLQNLRVNCAKKYLESSSERISNIAQWLGFKDEFYFSNWFKLKTGVSPSHYRKSLR